MGPRGQKYENFEKLFADLKRATKNAYKTCVKLPKRRKNNQSKFVMDLLFLRQKKYFFWEKNSKKLIELHRLYRKHVFNLHY